MNNTSLLGKKWLLKNADESKSILERLLENRNLHTDEEVAAFLNPSFSKMHDPFLMEDMQKVVNKIKSAIQNQDRIIVYGDYDVDGVTGTAIMVLILQKLGAKVSYRLPNRSEGYGLSVEMIEELHEKNVKLLITVDCGISCVDEIQRANDLDINVIITDHHTIPTEIPAAFAVLHPKLPNSNYPYTDLTGAGVALKLAQALIQEFIPHKAERENIFASYADLASLGTIADLGPLTGENRIIVTEGLNNMQTSQWDGLRHLLEVCGITEDETLHTNHVSFRIAPRINAAGRLDSAYYALKLFLTNGKEAQLFAEKLEKINKERQRLTELLLEEAEAIIQKQLEKEKILVAYHPSWPSGLVGIIAGKLSNKHGRPVVIMEERNDTYIGSARGPAYYNLVDALGNVSMYLDNFGGHVQAAGFTLPKSNKDVFIENLQSQARDSLKNEDQTPELLIDTEITGKDINMSLIEQINKIRPYGMKNQRPSFLIKNVTLHGLRRIGRDKNHLLGRLRIGQIEYKFIGFSIGDKISEIGDFTRADVVCHVEQNNYNGRTNIELQLLDLKLI